MMGPLRDPCREIHSPPPGEVEGQSCEHSEEAEREVHGRAERVIELDSSLGARGEVGSGPHPCRMGAEVSSLLHEETIIRQSGSQCQSLPLNTRELGLPLHSTGSDLEDEQWVPNNLVRGS